MPLLDLVTLPARLTVAGVETTLALGQLVSPDGPVRRKDGYADRAMVVIGEGGLIERLTAALTDPDGPMRLVTAVASALDPERPLGRALAPKGTLDRLLDADGFVEKLVAEGGTLDQLVALGDTLERIQPRLVELARLVPELHDSVETLSGAVEPLGQLAGRIPGGRRRVPVETP